MSFAARLTAWQRRHGRHDLPWQASADPYRVWLSEIMLQQTQVATVIPYYERFLERFPTLAALAAADLDDVLALWSGLGYYTRARNLHRAAQAVAAEHGGEFPRDPAAIARLPGIGRSTAAAIAVFAFGARAAILDGNVKRVLARRFGLDGDPAAAATRRRWWAQAEALLPQEDVAAYTQALMDLGAMVCTRARPRCGECPVADECAARLADRIAELPAPRRRRALPEKDVRWLVVTSGGDVLLERRPPTGVWGGLWSFPELPADAEPAAWLRERLGADGADASPLAPVRHAFTHFRLRAQPLRVELARRPRRAAEPGQLWIALDETAGVALPTPVRRLLAGLGRAVDADQKPRGPPR
ncbi:MAG: A/G-specific adenine glycosylase [Pseudomonadota bacterium]